MSAPNTPERIHYPVKTPLQNLHLLFDNLRFGERENVTNLADHTARNVIHLIKDVYPNPTIRQVAGYIDGVFNTWGAPVIAPYDAFPNVTVIGFKGIHKTGIPGQWVSWVVAMGHVDLTKVQMNVGVFNDNRFALGIFTICINPEAYNRLFEILRENNSGSTQKTRLMQKNGRWTILEDLPDNSTIEMSRIGNVTLPVKGEWKKFDYFVGYYIPGMTHPSNGDSSNVDTLGSLDIPVIGTT